MIYSASAVVCDGTLCASVSIRDSGLDDDYNNIYHYTLTEDCGDPEGCTVLASAENFSLPTGSVLTVEKKGKASLTARIHRLDAVGEQTLVDLLLEFDPTTYEQTTIDWIYPRGKVRQGTETRYEGVATGVIGPLTVTQSGRALLIVVSKAK